MAVLEIKTAGNPVLRQVASKVTRIDKRIKRLLSDMADTMYKADGVGLAAPQIGVSVRIVVIDAGEGIIEMINPEIISKEGSCVNVEGCLSVPNFDGEVERAKAVRVKYQDRSGKPIVLDATELLAIAVQHEVDHLDGILFIDKANALIPKE
ncbi:MAG: peptide deformylase [Acidaminococcaceae bacterium]